METIIGKSCMKLKIKNSEISKYQNKKICRSAGSAQQCRIIIIGPLTNLQVGNCRN